MSKGTITLNKNHGHQVFQSHYPFIPRINLKKKTSVMWLHPGKLMAFEPKVMKVWFKRFWFQAGDF